MSQEIGSGMKEREGKLTENRHGKDNKLLVWQYSEADEIGLDKTLPVDGQGESNRKPWLLYTLDVNTLNFCSFTMCVADRKSVV